MNTRAADRLLVVDGCDSDCARKTLEIGGFTDFVHFRVSDLGMEKDKTPVADDRIAVVATKLRELLAVASFDVTPCIIRISIQFAAESATLPPWRPTKRQFP